MEFFKQPNIDFMGKRRWAFALSGVVILLSLVVLFLHGGPRYGIDFTGGNLVQIHVEPHLDIAKIRGVVASLGISGAEVQNFGEANEYLIKYKEDVDPSVIQKALEEKYQVQVRIDRTEKVGPRIGEEIKRQAIWAVSIGLLLMLIYITIRFNFEFGVGAVLALFHDVLITLGIFTLLNREVTSAIVAALLTIVGYSINDSIVVSDRIRENSKRITPKTPIERLIEIFNRSINETLSRTVITSLTTLLVLIALLVFGGPVIFDFALALTIGVVVGTYSSIFVVASLVVEWEGLKRRKPKA